MVVSMLSVSGAAGAGVDHTYGDIVLGAAPPSVLVGQNESDTTVHLFPEQTNVPLSSAVDVDMSVPYTLYDPPDGRTLATIPSSTMVNSYYLQFDPVSGVRRALGSVTFDEPILGVIANGNQPPGIDTLSPSNFLGAPGTAYVSLPSYLGLETSRDKLWLYPGILAFDIVGNSKADHIRVITAASGAADPTEIPVITANLHIDERYYSAVLENRSIISSMKGPAINPLITDPTVTGAYVHVYSSTDSACYFLPPSNWSPSARGFVYLDQAQSNSPCTASTLRFKLLGFKCLGTSVAFSLDEMTQGTVNVDVTFGDVRYCTTLGAPYVQQDEGAFDLVEYPDARGRFWANRRASAPPFGPCPPPGSCP